MNTKLVKKEVKNNSNLEDFIHIVREGLYEGRPVNESIQGCMDILVSGLNNEGSYFEVVYDAYFALSVIRDAFKKVEAKE